MKLRVVVVTTIATLLLAINIAVPMAEAKNTRFKDVSPGDWHYESVHKLVDFGIINGYPDETFKPNQPITRAQVASIIARAMQLDVENVKNPNFQDVPANHTHYKSIAALTELGVFNKAEKFNPNHNVTRAQMAKILVTAFALESKKIKRFNDVKKDDWFYEYVGIIGDLKITSNKKEYNPYNHVTRAQVAAFITATIDHKRNDNKEDIWDTWTEWDAGVKNGKSQKEKTEKDILEIEKLHTDLKLALEAVKDLRNDVEDGLVSMEKAYKKERLDVIDEEAKQLKKTIKDFEKSIKQAERLITSAKKIKFNDLDEIVKEVEKVVKEGNDVLTETRKVTFDFDIQMDKRFTELEKITEKAERAIKRDRVKDMIEVYEPLKYEIEDTEYVLNLYRGSIVEILDEQRKELDSLLKESKKVYKQLDKEFHEELKQNRDTAENYFIDLFEEHEEILKNLRNDLNKAYRNIDISKIELLRKELNDEIKKAKDVLKQSRKVKLPRIAKYENDFEDEIEKAEFAYKRKDDEIKDIKEEFNELKKEMKALMKEIEKAWDRDDIGDVRRKKEKLESVIDDAVVEIRKARRTKYEEVEKLEADLRKVMDEARDVLK